LSKQLLQKLVYAFMNNLGHGPHKYSYCCWWVGLLRCTFWRCWL